VNEARYGKAIKVEDALVEPPASNYDISVPVQFERARINLHIFVDTGALMILGMYMHEPMKSYLPPAYVKTKSYNEYRIKFGKAPYTISGTLTVPVGEGKFPLVIIVPALGPLDMDGSSGPNKPYKDMAWGLASKGVAVFRYNKRTYSHSRVLIAEFQGENYTYKEEITLDALAAIAEMAKHPMVDAGNIYILGHGFGGMIAPDIAQGTKQLKGMIMAGANARPLQQCMIDQLHMQYDSLPLPEGKRGNVDAVIARFYFSMSKDLKLNSPDYQIPAGVGPNYWLALNKYDQVKLMKKLKHTPKLFTQGGRDIEVNGKDYAIWEKQFASAKNASFIFYPSLNHLMMPGEGAPNMEEYEVLNHVEEKFLTDIVLWIQQLKAIPQKP
jgi:hypothetical protein